MNDNIFNYTQIDNFIVRKEEIHFFLICTLFSCKICTFICKIYTFLVKFALFFCQIFTFFLAFWIAIIVGVCWWLINHNQYNASISALNLFLSGSYTRY